MKICTAIALLVFVSTAFSQTNKWKGIQPLYSTRTEVEKTLGMATAGIYAGDFIYGTETERITINYSQKPCDRGWNVPKDTVLSIEIPPGVDRNKSADDLRLDERIYFRQNDDAMYGTWTNLDSGVAYYFMNSRQVLLSIRYIPRLIDNSLRCDGFPPYVPETLYFAVECSLFHNPKVAKKYDVHTPKARVDNFSIAVNQAGLQYRGYVLVYFDDKLPIKEYRRRISSATRWARKVIKEPFERITIREGGMKEENEMCFYILPKDSKPPAPNPTLPSPQFMKSKSKSKSK
jgi:hypothetical protein